MKQKPLISIVSGTYNRLDYLKAMIESARLALPAGILSGLPRWLPYQFVIVDGGSTDGTLEYLHDQPDVVTVEHGRLTGAIRAFCDACTVAEGDYVIMANDDVMFAPYSIGAAYAHLEDFPNCGAVAFEDNRKVQGRAHGSFGVQYMPALNPGGQPVTVPYAQVGMFRRSLGDRVGWWGSYDPVMQQSRTYGGDNYLSARIWEQGYTVDTVPMARVVDHVVNDDLRHGNTEHTGDVHPDSAAYYERYPHGPQIAVEPSDPVAHDPHLRILYLPIFESHDLQRVSKRGLADALAKRGVVWEVDYINRPEVDLAKVVKAWQPHLLASQFQDAVHMTPDRLAYLRTLCPDMVCVNWHGDARGFDNPNYIQLLRHIDLQLVVNSRAIGVYSANPALLPLHTVEFADGSSRFTRIRKGTHTAYWQIGYEHPQGKLPEVPAHDVVFLGNCYSKKRQEMIRRLRELGVDVGVYGGGCEGANGECLYDFAKGEALYKAAKVAVGDTFTEPDGTLYEGFVSNRMIQALGAGGAVYLQQRVLELDKWTKFKAGVHYVEWSDLDDLCSKVMHYLQDEQTKDRKRIAANGKRVVMKHYTFDALVKQLFEKLLPEAMGAGE